MRHFSDRHPDNDGHCNNRVFNGTWKASNGCILKLRQEGSRLAGEYHADFTGAGHLEAFALSGFVWQDLLSFSVDFSRRGSLAAFTGRVSGDEQDGFHLVWLLTEVPEDNEGPGAILTGSTDFAPCEHA